VRWTKAKHGGDNQLEKGYGGNNRGKFTRSEVREGEIREGAMVYSLTPVISAQEDKK